MYIFNIYRERVEERKRVRGQDRTVVVVVVVWGSSVSFYSEFVGCNWYVIVIIVVS